MKGQALIIALTALALGAAATLSAGAPSLRSDRERWDDNHRNRGHRDRNVTVRVENRIVVEPAPPPIVVVPAPVPICVDVWTDERSYEIGEDVGVGFRVDRDCYVYVFSTDAYGRTHLIFPNRFDGDNFVHAGRRYELPDRNYRFVADGPAGHESITVVATTERYDWIRRDFGPECFRAEAFPTVQYAPADFYGRVESSAHLTIEGDRGRIDARYVDHGRPSVRGIRVESPVEYCEPPGYGQNSTVIRIREPYCPPPRPVCRPARLRISVSVSHADIYIDGNFYGRAGQEFELPPGRYEVSARANGYETWSRSVNLEEGRNERISVRMDRF